MCDILVSTDDPDIAEVCAKAGALVPWVRPAELATDSASSVDTAMHALNWYESTVCEVDGLLLLQPTSPFRTKFTIKRGIELFIKHDLKPVLGVSPIHAHPMWTLKIENECLVPFMNEHGIGVRTQELPTAYAMNGSFYLISPEEFRITRSFIGSKSIPLMIDSQKESLDVDTEWDFKIANMIVESGS
jgi:CMP-N-acetylneuraminic acid synthetase